MYIPKIGDNLKILTDDEVKEFVVINFGKYLRSTKEKFYSKLSEDQNLRKIAQLFYVFLTTPIELGKYVQLMSSSSSDNCICHYDIKILNLLYQELQLINTIPTIKNKLKELLNELKKTKVQSILVLEYKKRNDHKILHLSAKLTASDSDIVESFKYMHQSIITIIKNCVTKDWVVIEITVKFKLIFLSVTIDVNNIIEKWRQ